MVLAAVALAAVAAGLFAAATAVSTVDTRSGASGRYRTVDLDQACTVADPTGPPVELVSLRRAAPPVDPANRIRLVADTDLIVTVQNGTVVVSESDSYFKNGHITIVRRDTGNFDVYIEKEMGVRYCEMAIKDVSTNQDPQTHAPKDKPDDGWVGKGVNGDYGDKYVIRLGRLK
jgi:hypothetical protein